MSFSSVEVYAKEYFHTLNPIAQRISSDVASTRDAYEDLWITLSYKDQRQVLDETIIHPEAVLKYSFFPKNEPEVEYFPRLRIQTGEKYIIEEEGGKGKGYRWRDEHSAPFSYMTRSQLNLSVFNSDRPANSPKSKPAPGPVKHTEGFIDPPSIVLGGSTCQLQSPAGSKLKFPPEPSCAAKPPQDSLLTKLKNKTAVLKIQALKAKQSDGVSRKGTEAEREALVSPGSRVACVLPSTKIPKGKVSKPKTPPPPPPKKTDGCRGDPEKKALLQESPGDEIDVARQPEDPSLKDLSLKDPSLKALSFKEPSLKDLSLKELPLKELHEPSIEASKAAALEANLSLESLQEFHSALNSPSGSEDVPKTGFDFLDNW